MEGRSHPVPEGVRRRLPGLQARVQDLHDRYHRLFWTLHSIWALFWGAAVLVLAHNRYGYIPWVVLFLGLTWATTLFFSRFGLASVSPVMRFARGFVSYLTRIWYQGTLFFLLPFYFYSTTIPSWNCVFIAVLAALAVLSCFDLLFDRLLREHRVFALVFFAVVTFAALQLLIPLVLRLRLELTTFLAAAASLLAALPLAYGWRELLRPRRLARVALAFALVMGGIWALRPLLPPVPLRLSKVRFAARFDTATLHGRPEFTGTIPAAELRDGHLFAVATVQSPVPLRTRIALRFTSAGKVVTSTREVEITAHELGFRVWGVLQAGDAGFHTGTYTAELWTAGGQLIGRERVTIVDGPAAVR
jgi:hypothetical protein